MWEASDEEASSLLLFLPFRPPSQELLRVREVPGELETNAGWHHDRTLHQSLQRLFGYLPGLRKNCYSFSYILPGGAGTLSTSPDIEIVIGHVMSVYACLCVWEREGERQSIAILFNSDQLRVTCRHLIFFHYLSPLSLFVWDNWFVAMDVMLLFAPSYF